jgi:hypothetical protein
VVLFYKHKEVTSDNVDRYHPRATTMFTLGFFLEFLVLAVTPFPYHDRYVAQVVGKVRFYYFESELMNAFMALRLYFIIRAWFNYSVYTEIYTKKLC